MIAIYEIRNNRGVGHVGGDVDPNHMDATFVLAAAKWIVADLVRAFHDLETVVASQIVEALVQREVPLIWEVDGQKKVLDPTLTTRDKTLLLLYAHSTALPAEMVARWTQYKNLSRFREKIVAELSADALVHYGSDDRIHLSPSGVAYVEQYVLSDEAQN
jgi:hypothetical protein